MRTFTLVFDEQLDWTAFGIWLTMLLQARGEDILRVKGLLDVGGPGPVVLNGVQHVVHRPVHLETGRTAIAARASSSSAASIDPMPVEARFSRSTAPLGRR